MANNDSSFVTFVEDLKTYVSRRNTSKTVLNKSKLNGEIEMKIVNIEILTGRNETGRTHIQLPMKRLIKQSMYLLRLPQIRAYRIWLCCA